MRLYNKYQNGNKTVITILGIKIKLKDKSDTLLSDVLKQWETDYNPQKLETDIRRILQTPEAQKKQNRELLLIFSSTLVENNKPHEAKEILQQYITNYGSKEVASFPFLCNFAVSEGFNNPEIKTSALIFSSLEKNRHNNSLAELLKDKTVAIVGNSPNLKSQNFGKTIDNHDFVVRFNNYQTTGFENDYGSKTNIWICCQANDIINKPVSTLKKYSYILYNVDMMHTKLREACANNILFNLQYDIPQTYIGSEYKKQLKGIGVDYPSTGLSGIYQIYNQYPLKRNNIFGFSFLAGDTNYYDHYFAHVSQSKIKKFFKNCHHNFNNEAIFLRNLFKE